MSSIFFQHELDRLVHYHKNLWSGEKLWSLMPERTQDVDDDSFITIGSLVLLFQCILFLRHRYLTTSKNSMMEWMSKLAETDLKVSIIQSKLSLRPLS